ncbi:MAG: SRPBCC family protein [Synechococcus sp. SB0672_bin_10]|nr:SRPBCC family protein [Synechococcus sp. SB0672_bin_10]
MARWLEHSVVVDVAAPLEQVWGVWSDLTAMPRWMRWIESVRELEDPLLTEWTLAARGFRFTWKARTTRKVERQQLHWESVAGLPTKGAVRFYGTSPNSTTVKLSIGYALPPILAPLMKASLLRGVVDKELQANLERFKELVEEGAGGRSA